MPALQKTVQVVEAAPRMGTPQTEKLTEMPDFPPKNPPLRFSDSRGPPPQRRFHRSMPDLGSTLRSEYLGVQGPDNSQYHADHGHYRKGLGRLLRGLEQQSKKKTATAKLRQDTDKAKLEMNRAYQKFLEGTRMEKQKSDWTYTDAPGFFEWPQRYEQGEAKTCNRNKALSGIYDVMHPDFKPPHAEFNVYGGWSYFQTNMRHEQMGYFNDKTWTRSPMTEEELQTKQKLDESVARMTALSAQDALDNTTGYTKRGKIFESLGDHSCLKRTKSPWTEQRVSTHTTFHEYDGYKPGDHQYDTSLIRYVTDSDRAADNTCNVIVGNEQQKSFWKGQTAPGGTGTNLRQIRAQELVFQNTRGCLGLKPPSPKNQRKIMLKGTGTLCVNHFKDSLVQPPFEAFSPADRSQPP